MIAGMVPITAVTALQTDLEQARAAVEEWRKSAQHWEAEATRLEAERDRWIAKFEAQSRLMIALAGHGAERQAKIDRAAKAILIEGCPRNATEDWRDEDSLDNPGTGKVKPEDE